MKLKHILTILLVISGFFLATYFFSHLHYPTSNSSKAHLPIAQVQVVELDIDVNIPKTIYPCLPKKVERLRLLASNTTEQNTYYFVAIHLAPQPQNSIEPFPPTYQETLVKLDTLGCLVVVPKEKLGSVSLTQYVPESVARSLSLEKHRKLIVNAGGKQKFEQSFSDDRDGQGETTYLFPEDVWALEQLGVNIPSSVQVITDVEQLYSE